MPESSIELVQRIEASRNTSTSMLSMLFDTLHGRKIEADYLLTCLAPEDKKAHLENWNFHNEQIKKLLSL